LKETRKTKNEKKNKSAMVLYDTQDGDDEKFDESSPQGSKPLVWSPPQGHR
jgi:hypothetical protein